MNRVVMLDFDGVIVDSFDTFYESFLAACRSHGFPGMNGREAFLKLFDTNLFDGMGRAGIPSEMFGPILKTMSESVEGNGGTCGFFPGVPEALRRLAITSRLFVITSNLTANAESILHAGDVRCVEEIFGSDKERSKVRKMRSVMARFPGARYYYVGDTKGDMLEAREAGALAVGAAWGWHSTERLLEARPDHIATSPEDLVRALTEQEKT